MNPVSRRWVYTNNCVPDVGSEDWKDDHHFEVRMEDVPHCVYHAWQIELSESGKTHQQGYMVLSKPVRLSHMVGSCAGVHFEIARGTHEQCLEYVTKNDTRVDGPHAEGQEPKGQGTRSDLARAVQDFRESNYDMVKLAEDHPVSVVKFHRGFEALRSLKAPTARASQFQCFVLYGSARSGKTSHVVSQAKDLYIIPDEDCKWFDGYRGQKQMLLDDYSGRTPLHTLLKLMDRYPLQLPIKGGFVSSQVQTLWITSNYDPMEWMALFYRNESVERGRALLGRMTAIYCSDTPDERPPGWIPLEDRFVPPQSPEEIAPTVIASPISSPVAPPAGQILWIDNSRDDEWPDDCYDVDESNRDCYE